jgi:hypothetical protein
MNQFVAPALTQANSAALTDRKRDLLERLSALRLAVIGGLVGRCEPEEFYHLATNLLEDVKVYEPSLQTSQLDQLIAKVAKARDGDTRLTAAQTWVDGLSLLLSERIDERAIWKLAPQRPPRLLIFLILAVLVLLLGTTWYRQTFIDEFVFPNRKQRLADLRSIVQALEAFRVDRGAYPVSAGGGKEWSGYLWSGTGEAWIVGLAGIYIPKLPRDPRNAVTRYMQYVYKSDGQKYKLLSLLPEDCSATIVAMPELSDPSRNGHRCTSYGYWTQGAERW